MVNSDTLICVEFQVLKITFQSIAPPRRIQSLHCNWLAFKRALHIFRRRRWMAIFIHHDNVLPLAIIIMLRTVQDDSFAKGQRHISRWSTLTTTPGPACLPLRSFLCRRSWNSKSIPAHRKCYYYYFRQNSCRLILQAHSEDDWNVGETKTHFCIWVDVFMNNVIIAHVG